MRRDIARARVVAGTLIVCVILAAGKLVADVGEWWRFALGGG